MNRLRRQMLMAAVCAWIVALTTGCDRPSEKDARREAPAVRTEDMSRGDIRLRFHFEPARVHYDADTILTISVNVPSEYELELPPLNDRVQGFTLQGVYSSDKLESGGRRKWELHANLTPTVGDEHRIAPIAIAYTDHGHSPPRTGWIATRPLVLESVQPVDNPPDSIRDAFSPVWIAPSFWRVAAWIGAVLLVALMVVLAVRFGRRLHKEAILRQLSPRERAMRELDELLRKQLIEKHRVKDFYVELTMIVRRYIERAHGVRAPEQTTEEFLAAVRDNPRFNKAVLERLRAFLEAADLVKFAAYQPDSSAVDDATRTAREYVEADSREQEDRQAQPAGEGTA